MTITYETLFEILRKEKNQEDLQKLDDDFFSELKRYLDDKNKLLAEKPRLDQFLEGYENEQNAVRTQIHNIKKLSKDIFDRRERKIIEMAINKAKTGSTIVDSSCLLPEEREFFNEQIRVISGFRGEVLESTLNSVRPQPRELESPQEEPKELNMDSGDSIDKDFKKVQVLESVPKFVGVDLEIYGPFNENDEVDLRPEIAEMLVKTSKARIVEP